MSSRKKYLYGLLWTSFVIYISFLAFSKNTIRVECLESTKSIEEIPSDLVFNIPTDKNQVILDNLTSIQEEKKNIFFLKLHKCASSSIQNILFRYGFENNLDFALPYFANYIGHPQYFTSDLLKREYATSSGKYNILTHHLRFNKGGIQEVMYDNAVWITILRDPAYLYESLYGYYNLQKFYHVSLRDLLKTPENYPQIYEERLNKRIGINQMSFDLGMDPGDFGSKESIENFIKMVDETFHLVMIADYMEASLVMMADLLSWPLERVMSLKLNTRLPTNIAKLSLPSQEILRRVNAADSLLYGYFKKKFKRLAKEFGEEKLRKKVIQLVILNEKLNRRCIAVPDIQGQPMLTPAKTLLYNVSNKADEVCKYATAKELEFTKELRRIQADRMLTLRRLDELFTTQND